MITITFQEGSDDPRSFALTDDQAALIQAHADAHPQFAGSKLAVFAHHWGAFLRSLADSYGDQINGELAALRQQRAEVEDQIRAKQQALMAIQPTAGR